MRNELDLSQHHASRWPRVVLIVSTLGVALVAAWVFTPILLANYSAMTATLRAGAKPRAVAPDQPTAPTLASAQAGPVEPAAPAPITTALASTDEQAAAANTPAAAPAGPAAETTAAVTPTLPPWPQDRGLQVAAPAPMAAPPPADDAGSMQVASVSPTIPAAEPFDRVPLPRKRPSRQIAASLVIPLPRPRPEIEGDPPPEPSLFDLQVERMR